MCGCHLQGFSAGGLGFVMFPTALMNKAMQKAIAEKKAKGEDTAGLEKAAANLSKAGDAVNVHGEKIREAHKAHNQRISEGLRRMAAEKRAAEEAAAEPEVEEVIEVEEEIAPVMPGEGMVMQPMPAAPKKTNWLLIGGVVAGVAALAVMNK